MIRILIEERSGMVCHVYADGPIDVRILDRDNHEDDMLFEFPVEVDREKLDILIGKYETA